MPSIFQLSGYGYVHKWYQKKQIFTIVSLRLFLYHARQSGIDLTTRATNRPCLGPLLTLNHVKRTGPIVLTSLPDMHWVMTFFSYDSTKMFLNWVGKYTLYQIWIRLIGNLINFMPIMFVRWNYVLLIFIVSLILVPRKKTRSTGITFSSEILLFWVIVMFRLGAINWSCGPNFYFTLFIDEKTLFTVWANIDFSDIVIINETINIKVNSGTKVM